MDIQGRSIADNRQIQKGGRMKISFDIEDNVLIKNIPMPDIGNNIYRQEIVIDKDTFVKCYEEWIVKERENE